MSTRAKFKVDSVEHYEYGGNVKMSPVYTGSEENKGFWEATPSGSLQMRIDNQKALAQFEPGKEFYLDFTPAPAE